MNYPQRWPAIQRYLVAVMVLLVSTFALLRFYHLDADFPVQLDWSADLYTDEGWYANGATRHAIGLPWYAPGDFNPSVNMPLGQLIHSLFFSLSGLSLFSARLPGACATAVTLAGVVYAVRPLYGSAVAWLAALVFSVNFMGFAFSRVAFMEPLGVALVGLALLPGLAALRSSRKHNAATWLACASLMAGLACLVKTSMLFGFPAMACLAWGCPAGRSWRDRGLFMLAALLPGACLLEAWQLAAQSVHGADYAYFITLNIHDRMITGLAQWWALLPVQLSNVLVLGDGFVFATLLLCGGALVISAAFRRNVLVHAMLAALVSYFLLLTFVQYGPPRYFYPLLLPLSILCAISCAEWMAWFSRAGAVHRAIYPVLLVAAVMFFEARAVLAELEQPQYSLQEMARSAGALMAQREGRLAGVAVLGDPADTLALMTGVTAVNPGLGTAPLAQRLARTQPRYALLLGEDKALLDKLRQAGVSPRHLRDWDVYGNYLFNSPRLGLWALDWHAQQAAPQAAIKP